MICGKRGDRGVCPMEYDHNGNCETNLSEPLFYTEEEKGWQRFNKVMSDLCFAFMWHFEHRQ